MGCDEDAIRQVHATWIVAVNAGDLPCLLNLMTDDAILLNPGQAPFGSDGFAATFSAAHERFRIRCISELQEVVVGGDLAHALSQDSLSLAPRAGGPATELAGWRLTVYRQQRDGRWLLARDAHTLSPLAA